MKTMKGMEFNPLTMELTMTTTAANKAGKVGTPEYDYLKKLRTDYPGLIINVKAKAKTSNGMNFTHMASIIKQCRDSKQRLAIFERVQEISKGQECPYLYVKEWFLANYANHDATPEFDKDGYLIVKTKAELEAEKTKKQNVKATERETETEVEEFSERKAS